MRRYIKNYTSRYSKQYFRRTSTMYARTIQGSPGCSITAYWNYYEQEKYTVAAKDEQLIFRPDEKKIIQTFS